MQSCTLVPSYRHRYLAVLHPCSELQALLSPSLAPLFQACCIAPEVLHPCLAAVAVRTCAPASAPEGMARAELLVSTLLAWTVNPVDEMGKTEKDACTTSCPHCACNLGLWPLVEEGEVGEGVR